MTFNHYLISDYLNYIMWSFIVNVFSEKHKKEEAEIPLSKHKVSKKMLHHLRSQVIKSAMYLPYYDSSKTVTCFKLPEKKRLYFVASTHIVNQITRLEESEVNPYTLRKQAYKFNQALLHRNPVSMEALHGGNYVKHQHKLFIALAQDIRLDQVTIPKIQTIRDSDIVKFVSGAVAQVYLPVLLNVDTHRVSQVTGELNLLLSLLETATGKHGITFADYLAGKVLVYSDELEQKYIELFRKIIITLKCTESRYPYNETEQCYVGCKEQLCTEIVELLRDSNIMTVLTTQFDIRTEAVIIVNNILSWIDNMLNVVHTVVNLLVLVSANGGHFDKQFYKESLPKARALATMFMRHVTAEFDVIHDNGSIIHFNVSDIIMLSNGNHDTVFGGAGRKCPSKPWSLLFMERIMQIIVDHFTITSTHNIVNGNGMPTQDTNNDSWFWNKLSTHGLVLTPRE